MVDRPPIVGLAYTCLFCAELYKVVLAKNYELLKAGEFMGRFLARSYSSCLNVACSISREQVASAQGVKPRQRLYAAAQGGEPPVSSRVRSCRLTFSAPRPEP